MYRSLHTTVFGPDDRLVQTQIRTFSMDKVASLVRENYHNNYLAYANYQIITENDQDNLLKKFCEEYTIETIIVEEVRPEGNQYGVGNQKTHKALMYLQGAIVTMVHDE